MPQAGQHHDTFYLEAVFAERCQVLEDAGLGLQGLFLNANKAFNVNSLRQACARRDVETSVPRNRRAANWQTDDDTLLDPEFYRRRQVIKQLNAWLDGFNILLVWFETCLHTWLAFH